MTVRERLDTLTTKLWAGVDDALNTAGEDPAPSDSIDGMNADIAATVTAIDDAVADLPAIQAEIGDITAIAAGDRTDAQKDRLTDLRVAKTQQQAIIALLRQQRRNLATLKTVTRQGVIRSRFAMLLDGGPARVRQSDIDGTE